MADGDGVAVVLAEQLTQFRYASMYLGRGDDNRHDLTWVQFSGLDRHVPKRCTSIPVLPM